MIDVDVAIVGGGFGGSLMSLVLQRSGLRVALIDRGRHPRFAIGESSTPIANLVLSDLCREYGLPRIAPLTKYGTWQAAHPELICGIKRGFSYFHHREGQPFVADGDHSTELLVAASSHDERADTHWLRQDVDQFLFEEARVAGVFCFEDCDVSELRPTGHAVELSLANGSLLRCRFLIDGAGEGRFLVRRLNLEDRSHEMRTRSRTVFAHFGNVTRWGRLLHRRGIDIADHPFDCDHAALHHVFNEGWMWQLRFNEETLSAGFVQNLAVSDESVARPPLGMTPSDEWNWWLSRFPSIAEQFANAAIVRPATGLRSTGRLQRKVATAVGDWWALLPNSAGFVDPLHSSGIAHTLCGIERLARVLIQNLGRDELRTRLQEYERCVLGELELIDLLVSGCFAATHDFRRFASMSMLYFAAATSYERARLASSSQFQPAFLLADNANLCATFRRLCDRSPLVSDSDEWADELAETIRPFNLVGLCDPTLKNMYRQSALPD